MPKPKYFSFDCEEKEIYMIHDTEEAAKCRAQRALERERRKASGELWHSEIEYIAWGVIIESAQRVMETPEPTELDGEPVRCEFDAIVDYELADPDLDFEALDEYADMMTVKEFEDAVKIGGFINGDGLGALATATKLSNQRISPSSFTKLVEKNRLPKWATHVAWYNR